MVGLHAPLSAPCLPFIRPADECGKSLVNLWLLPMSQASETRQRGAACGEKTLPGEH